MAEKLALQLKVDLLAEKAIKKMNQLSLLNPKTDTKPRSMTTEELAVFIEQIQNIHNAKVVNNANEGFKPKEEKTKNHFLKNRLHLNRLIMAELLLRNLQCYLN